MAGRLFSLPAQGDLSLGVAFGVALFHSWPRRHGKYELGSVGHTSLGSSVRRFRGKRCVGGPTEAAGQALVSRYVNYSVIRKYAIVYCGVVWCGAVSVGR